MSKGMFEGRGWVDSAASKREQSRSVISYADKRAAKE